MLSTSRPRRLMVLIIGLFAVAFAAAPADAFAGGKKGKKKNGRKGVPSEIVNVGVQPIDVFFKDVKDIDHRVDRAQGARRDGRNNINTALGLKKGTPLADAVKEIQALSGGNLQVAMTSGLPMLASATAVPSNVAGAIEAVNAATAGYASAISDLAGVPKRTANLVKKAQKLPAQLKAEYSDGFNPLEIPQMLKQTKSLKDNIKLTTALPKRTKKVIKGLNKDMDMLVESFGGTWPPEGAGKKGKGRK